MISEAGLIISKAGLIIRSQAGLIIISEAGLIIPVAG